jgi:hypothetical protein
MRRTPRRRRVRLTLWLFLALFGADEDPDDTTADSATDPEPHDDRSG